MKEFFKWSHIFWILMHGFRITRFWKLYWNSSRDRLHITIFVLFYCLLCLINNGKCSITIFHVKFFMPSLTKMMTFPLDMMTLFHFFSLTCKNVCICKLSSVNNFTSIFHDVLLWYKWYFSGYVNIFSFRDFLALTNSWKRVLQYIKIKCLMGF